MVSIHGLVNLMSFFAPTRGFFPKKSVLAKLLYNPPAQWLKSALDAIVLNQIVLGVYHSLRMTLCPLSGLIVNSK